MSLFEEYLTIGPWLAEEQRRDLYKYLLLTRQEKYQQDTKILISNGFLESSIANGDLFYSIDNSAISYKSKKFGETQYGYEMRTLPLSRLRILNNSRIKKFFAQAELDVLRNFPKPGKELEENRGYSINLYAYYDLNYYSSGRGKFLGFFNKLRTKDGELLINLLAS